MIKNTIARVGYQNSISRPSNTYHCTVFGARSKDQLLGLDYINNCDFIEHWASYNLCHQVSVSSNNLVNTHQYTILCIITGWLAPSLSTSGAQTLLCIKVKNAARQMSPYGWLLFEQHRERDTHISWQSSMFTIGLLSYWQETTISTVTSYILGKYPQ